MTNVHNFIVEIYTAKIQLYVQTNTIIMVNLN